ncbi:anthranilate synthase [Vibrio phage VP06]|nr:anthranilate synthase [Vibrio phage VP06]
MAKKFNYEEQLRVVECGWTIQANIALNEMRKLDSIFKSGGSIPTCRGILDSFPLLGVCMGSQRALTVAKHQLHGEKPSRMAFRACLCEAIRLQREYIRQIPKV